MAEVRRAGAIQGLALVLPVFPVVMGSAILASTIPLMIKQFHDLPNVGFWVPAMVTVPSMVLALLSPFAGMVADAVGRRRMMIWALVAYSIVGMAPLLIRDFWPLFATRILVGVTEAFILTASSVLIGDYFTGKRRDHWLAMQTTTATLAAMVLVPLGGFIGSFGWQYVFAMYGCSLLLLPFFMLTTWEPEQMKRAARKAIAWGPVTLIVLAVAAVVGAVGYFTGVAAPLLVYVAILVAMAAIGVVTARKHEAPSAEDGASWAGFPWLRLTGICTITAATSLMFYLVLINMAQILAEGGLTDPAKAGLYIALVSMGIPVGTLVFSRLSRTPVSILLVVEFTIIAVSFFGMSRAPSFVWLMAFAGLNQFGCGLVLPTLFTWTVRQFTFAQRGRGVGFWQGFLNGGQFVGVSFIALVAATFTGGKITPSFAYVAVLAAVIAAGALMALLLGKGAKPVAYVSEAEDAAVAIH